MNILIVSAEAWRDTNNGGNVLSNLFRAFPDANIAQIYCSCELPQNAICRKYFQIADSMLLTGVKGRTLEERSYFEDTSVQTELVDNKIKNSMPHIFREPALLAREFLWTFSNWKTKELENFVLNFHPDIIFAPCYSYYHMTKLTLHVKKIARCPMISYVYDDNYSFKQFRISLSFWINRLITRKWIRRHFAEASLIYTMTDLQKREYEASLKRPMKILCKAADFLNGEKRVRDPIRFIYAGGLYLNRWKMLQKLSESIATVNQAGKKAELHIYSNSGLNARKMRCLNDGQNSFLHKAVSYEDLMVEYKRSDIAVHVESFDLKNRLITRMSFSTKIIDCMNSGCAILAIGPDTQAGIAYLKENDAAICVNDVRKISGFVENLLADPNLILEYAEKAKRLGIKNHLRSNIEKNLRLDFHNIIAGN